MKIFNKISITALVVVFSFSLIWLIKAATTVNLNTADNFAVLAGSAITNTGITTITGDVGVYPTITETGFGSVALTGTNHFGDAVTQQGKADLVTAYNDAAGQASTSQVATELGGTTKTTGVYDSAAGTFGITGTLTLDGQGDPNAVFIFKTASTLITASASHVSLINRAQACNVFWQVGSSVTLGTTSDFKGNILAFSSITDNGGSTVVGRFLARNAAVTLNNTVINRAVCAGGAPATLHVIKLVINGNNGHAAASDFMIHVKLAGAEVVGSPASGTAATGTLYSLDAGSYVVSENANDLYVQSFSGAGCDSNGNVTLSAGQDKICTIINTIVPLVFGGPGNNPSPQVTPLIGILKVPTPLALPAGPGLVTYDYTVWNVGGQQALANITVTDDKCSSINFISGDLNNNSKLDPTESWKYSCTMTLQNTTVNTAVATGYSDDAYHQPAIATAVATVVVGSALPSPLINIVKVPSRLTPFPFGGGEVTYTYTVTNPGVVAMYDVFVVDDKCGPVANLTGDTNGNNLLEPGETWTYTCQTKVAVSTRNVATVQGRANGFIALGYAFADVFVSVPGLPNAGVFADGNDVLPKAKFGGTMLIGIGLVILSLVIIAIRRKAKI